MQVSMRVNQQTYNLIKAEAQARNSTMSKVLDDLVVAGLELDRETRLFETPKRMNNPRPTPLPKPKDLQAILDDIFQILPEPAEAEPEVRYNIVHATEGNIIAPDLSVYEAEDYLRNHDLNGDLTMLPAPEKRK